MKIINILIFISIIFLGINTASSETYINDTLEYSSYQSIYHNGILYNPGAGGLNNHAFSASVTTYKVRYGGAGLSGDPSKLTYIDVKVTPKVAYIDIPQSTGGGFAMYSGTTYVGSGAMYIRKAVGSTFNIEVYFDEDCSGLATGTYSVQLYSSIIYNYFTDVYYTSSDWLGAPAYTALHICFGPSDAGIYPTFIHNTVGSEYITYDYNSVFKNDYSLKFTDNTVTSIISRDVSGGAEESAYVLKDELANTIFNSGNTVVNATYYHDNGSYNYYLYTPPDTTYHLIYSNLVNPDILTDATLSFNQSRYNISDVIQFDYTYLDDLYDTEYLYDLQLYYYSSTDTIEYLYNVPLISPLDNYDDTGYINTYGWVPNKLYYGVIRSDLPYKQSKKTFLSNVKLSDYVNLTHPYEYVNDTCTGTNCQYYNGDVITISYNTFTDQVINIIDSDNNIVQILGPYTGYGTIQYTIPFDDSKQYTYPSWSITMDTYYDNMSVYWLEESEYADYADADEYIDQESVEENLDTLADSIKPIKELIIGFGGVIIENPDYDNNGIVGAGELDQWFNGIIGILIAIAIFVFYKGLKDR